jgi:hypothetical protein
VVNRCADAAVAKTIASRSGRHWVGSALSQSSSAVRPAAVILTRPATIALPSVLRLARSIAASPARTGVSQRLACEPVVGEHDCLGGAERNAGEQLKRSPPFDTDVTFLIAIDDSCAEVQLPR